MIDKVVIYFFIYCFVGWCCEVLYCSIPERRFINRGFLYGPYLPIYGTGALAVLSIVKYYNLNFIILFFVGVVVCSIIEYIGSLILEKTFHVKLWDYSSNFGNINGRVCALNSTLFGLLCLVVVYFIHPLIVQLVGKLPNMISYYLATIIEVALAFDFAMSVVRMRVFAQAMDEVRVLTRELSEKVEALQFESREVVLAAKEKLERELNLKKANFAMRSKSVFRAYPSMKMRDRDREIELQFQLFKMELKSFIKKGRLESNLKKEKLNLIYENTKAKIKSRH